MKKILLILMAGLLLAACSEKDEIMRGNQMLSLRMDKAVRASGALESRANPNHLSALEIVKQAFTLCYWLHGVLHTGLGFPDNRRDLVNERLLIPGFWIINPENGALQEDFIDADDVIITRQVKEGGEVIALDTIAYVPNRTLRIAATAIREAYAQKDYKTVYKLMDDAYTFRPITGAEWRAMKASGEN